MVNGFYQVTPMRVIEDGFAYHRSLPAPIARHYIDHSWVIQARLCRTAVEALLPDPDVEVYFNLGPGGRQLGDTGPSASPSPRRAWVIGAHANPLLVTKETADCDVVGVRLAPAVATQVFRMPVSELTGQMVDLDLVWKGSDAIIDRLAAKSDPQRRIAFLEQALRDKVRSVAVTEELRRARELVRRVVSADPDASIADLRREIGIGHHRLISAFEVSVGMKPKIYQRIVRLRRVLRLVAQGRLSWAQTALQVGYYDQAHLANEFKLLTGLTLTEYDARRSWVNEGTITHRLAASAAAA